MRSPPAWVMTLAIALGLLTSSPIAAWADPGTPIVVVPDDKFGVVDTTVRDPGHRGDGGRGARGGLRGASASGSGVTCSYTPMGLVSIGLPEDYGFAATGGINNAGMGLFARTCSDGSFDVVWRNPAWLVGGPAGGGVVVTPAQLAQIAYSRLPLPVPRARFNPAQPTSAGPATTVNLPTWWWIDDWTEQRQRTSAGAVWALVTARPVATEWQPGDGGHPVVCQGPGVPWRPGLDGSAGACTYTYRASSGSERDLRYDATVTVVWQVSWVGAGGASGTLPEMRMSATFPVAVMERQSVVVGSGGGKQ
jgi:hypothetical protein